MKIKNGYNNILIQNFAGKFIDISDYMMQTESDIDYTIYFVCNLCKI